MSIFRYAESYLATHDLPQSSKFHKWTPTSEEEMRRFIAMTVAMRLTKQSDLCDYWSTDEIIHIPFYRKIMSRDRFLSILTFFHLADNDHYIPRGQSGYDPLFKLGTFYHTVTNNFSTYWLPGREIAVDEGLVPFNGRIHFKVYNPMKPKKYGMKSFELCDGSNAYCCKYKLYCGDDGQPGSDKGKTYDTVMHLCRDYTGVGRVLFVDNYYSSPQLFHDLSKGAILATGTCRYRKGFSLFIFELQDLILMFIF